MEKYPIQKNEDSELPIPLSWRPTLKKMADAIVLGQHFEADRQVSIDPIDPETASINRNSIDCYPDTLGPLGAHTWETSVYIWDAGYWQILLDLTTEDGDSSDLVLHVRVRENGEYFVIEPGLVYVP